MKRVIRIKKRKDESLFSLTPEKKNNSPLDVKGIKTKASTEDILAAVRESRRGM